MTGDLVGLALGLLTSAAWALANVYIQRAARAEGDLRALFWSQVGLGSVLLPLAWAWEGPPTWPGWTPLLVTGVGSALGYYGMTRAFRLGPLSAIVPLVTTWSVPAMLTAAAWHRERPSLAEGAGAVVVLAGAAIAGATARGGEWHGSRMDAAASALLGAVGFGVMTIGADTLRPDLGGLGTVPASWLLQWALLWPVLLRVPGVLRPPRAWGAVIGMTACEAVGYAALIAGLERSTVATVGPMASLSPLLTMLYGVLVLGEPVRPVQWAAVAAVIGGSVLLAG